MRRILRPRLWFLLGIAFLIWCAAPPPAASDAIRCDVESTPPANPYQTHFTPFRFGSPIADRHYRDLEMMWDSLYTGGLNGSTIETLKNYIRAVDDSVSNPFGIMKPDFQIVYEYFRRNDIAYDENPADTTSVVLGRPDKFADIDGYNPSDRCHSDVYLFEKPGRDAILTGNRLPTTADGEYPSKFGTPDEDVSTGHDNDYASIKHGNSVMVMGPPVEAPYDLDGTGWTKPDQLRDTGFCHEFQHSIPGQPAGLYSEFYSALAEAVSGTRDETASGEVPYVWPLVSYLGGPKPKCDTLLRVDSNYKERTAFAAYLVYNFRGADTTATLAALRDDLAHTWATNGSTTLVGLRDLLSDSNCWDCAQKSYFHPGGVAMDTVSRLALLLHNWRVANYVNNSALAEHQYGFPPHLGAFSPARHLGAWQSTDGCAGDDIVAIPPEVVLTADQAVRETTFVGSRQLGGATFPMTLQPLGAEYWVLRCDPTAAVSGQDLVVRVSPEAFYRPEQWHYFGQCHVVATADGRLMASVAPYTPPADQVLTAQLWQHPEWATDPVAPTWTAVDSLAGALEYIVPGFGSSTKAALVTLSLADGPTQAASSSSGITEYTPALPYRVSFALRKGAYQAQNPQPQVASSATLDEEPAWSPGGDSLAFTRRSLGTGKIYLKVLSGSTPQQMLPGSPAGDDQSKPDWSPRGDYVLFTLKPAGSSQQDLWVYNRRLGTDLRRVTTTSGLSMEGAFQPNGQGMAYIRYNAAPEPLWEINTVNLDGTGTMPVMFRWDSGADLRSPRWSPDGQWVYFTANDSLFAVGAGAANHGVVVNRSSLGPAATTFDLPLGRGNLVVEQPGQLTNPVDCIASYDGHWCPDCPSPGLVYRPFRRIALTDTLKHDTQARFYRTSASFFGPRWAPDGTRIAYTTNQNLTTDRDIYVGQTSYDHAPSWTNAVGQLADQTIPAGTPWTQQFNASDSDGEAVTFVGAYLPSGSQVVTVNPTTALGEFDWPNPGPVGAIYYIVFRALDPSGGVANKVVRYTIIQSGGGGGCPIADLKTASGWVTQNSVLARSADGALSLDAYRLPGVPQVIGNTLALRLRENEAEQTTLDRVRLAVVDHAAGTEVFASGDQPKVGTRAGAFRVVTSKGIDVTSQVDGSTLGTGYAGQPGDTLLVQMSPPGGAGSYSVNSTLGGGGGDGLLGGSDKYVELRYDPGTGLAAMTRGGATLTGTIDQLVLGQSGILVQTPDGSGGWTNVTHYYPREYASETVLPSLGGSALRLIFVGQHHLTFIGRVVPASILPTVTLVSPAVASHSRLGNVRPAVMASGTTTTLVNGDTLTMAFGLPTAAANAVRDYVLLTDGVYTTVSAQARLTPTQASLPVRFALGQNAPNPFTRSTTIRFELPVAGKVRIEVFDLLGRRVRTLTDLEWPAGYHAVEWDGRDESGREIHSGVFLYRMTAGSFRDQRKMVITP